MKATLQEEQGPHTSVTEETSTQETHSTLLWDMGGDFSDGEENGSSMEGK